MKPFIFIFLFSIFGLQAQTIRFNEVVSSNSVYFDEDGDTPDWIELYNSSHQTISINGWSLSDDEDHLLKWTFPNVSLAPNQYLLLWASSKDKRSIEYPKTLVNKGDSFKYILPTSEPNTNWKNLNFNDTNWAQGISGFGYADGDDNTIIPSGTKSIYLRKNFTIDDVDNIASLILDIDYDDAFVAYINGQEVARANINGVPPTFNANTIQDHEAKMYTGGKPDRFSISNFKNFLNDGENILSIQGHNVSANSSDFTIIPFLSAIFKTPNSLGVDPPAILNLKGNNFHTNFKIASKSETLFLADANGEIVDEITAAKLPPNSSIGISINSDNIVHYTETTPGFKNSTNEFLGVVTNSVVFSHQGGVIQNPINLVLSGNASNEDIRYTLDGREPNASSLLYTNPIQINNNKNIRAKLFSNNQLPSKTYTKSYILGANHQLDIISLTTEPRNLFDEDYGIYVFGAEGTYNNQVPYYGANFWEDWERPIHFAFYENDSDEIAEFNGGIKIFGGWSRGQNDQRSLALFARGQYGDTEFKHSFFNTLNYTDFQSLVLRNSGQDWLKSSMKDIMLTSLMRGSNLDFQEHNPTATYINGKYWGMYNLREKVNEHMLASKHNINADDVTLLTNNAEVLEGNNEEYNNLINYINTTDLSIATNFEYVNQQIDIKEYILYQAANIFFNNTDWPGNNIKFWKHPEGKWRWIMYDTDFSFGPFWNAGNYYEDTLNFALEPYGPAWPNPSWSTLLFRRLITNTAFRNQFINRYADELNSRFLPEHIKNHIDAIHQTIAPEIEAHYNNWGENPSLATYFINQMKIFAENRPLYAKNHIKAKFNLANFHQITISSKAIEQGFVEINENLKIKTTSWSGDYFETVPIQLRAIPEAGYEFSHWSGAISSTNKMITIALEKAIEITPNFKKSTTEIPLVINEINYKSNDAFNADDWVEIYNPNTFTVDISNWLFKDDDDTHVFTIPSGTTISAKGFLIVVKDISDFTAVYPKVKNFVGAFDFGLGTSDAVRLFNADNVLQDEVIYDDSWANCADETGRTLELIATDLENHLPQNWDCSNSYGSPNIINDATLSDDDIVLSNLKIYPNPVIDNIFIAGDLNDFSIQIHNAIGQKVLTFKNTKILTVKPLTKGLYFMTIYDKNKRTTLKFIKK
ncbi:CotH kinase family protein [Polaribacter sp. M15]